MSLVKRREARLMLTNYLELLESMVQPHDGYVYRNAADFLLRHAVWYEPSRYPADVGQGMPKHCYGNAILLAATRSWKYVEGYALAPILQQGAFPVHHAWNVDQQGQLVDSTWRNNGLAYYGVEFSVERAEEATWDGDGSVLDDWLRGFPLFKEPWTGERDWPASPRLALLRAGKFEEYAALLTTDLEKGGNGKT